MPTVHVLIISQVCQLCEFFSASSIAPLNPCDSLTQSQHTTLSIQINHSSFSSVDRKGTILATLPGPKPPRVDHMDLLKAKQIRSIMQEVENSVVSSESTSSEEDEREHPSTRRRRESAASQEKWAESITSSSLGPSIWGSQVSAQERGRASRSASFSVGQELVKIPMTATKHKFREPPESLAYDQTRLMREQFQQMKFKNRSKSSYAAAWHVPNFNENDAAEDAILDEDDLFLRTGRGDPPGLKYITPSNPRMESLRGSSDRRASFNAGASFDNADATQSVSPAKDNLLHERHFTSQDHHHEHARSEILSNSNVTQFAKNPGQFENYGNLMADVDRYFSSDDHRTRTRTYLAQSAAAQSALLTATVPPIPNGPLYIVEFKACRTDVFYIAEGSGIEVHVGDLVIVEADRGRDLGKVIRENVSMTQVRALKAQQAREQALAMGGMQDDTDKLNAENIQPKLIYRLSQSTEIAMLLVKSQDEQQAMLVCQAKVRQRKLPMEVLDGEYQWDRRKLTFYYYASQRIDFRELVRDLFKIYKTRIWMCASNPTSVINANIPLGAPGAIGEPKSQHLMSTNGPNFAFTSLHLQGQQSDQQYNDAQMTNSVPYGFHHNLHHPAYGTYSNYLPHQVLY